MIRIFLFMSSVLLVFTVLEVTVRNTYGKQLLPLRDEELLWKYAPSQTGYSNIGFPKATINSNGFRGGELKENKRNIIMLGDSYTFGMNVQDNETFSYLLGEKLARIDQEYQVINTGVSAWGLFQEKIQLERMYAEYKPEIVVLTLLKDDLRRLEFRDETNKRKYLKTNKYGSILYRNSALIQFMKTLKRQVLKEEPKNWIHNTNTSQLWDIEKEKVKEIHSLLWNNTVLILVFYPSSDQAFFEPVKEMRQWPNVIVIGDLGAYFELFANEELRIKNDGHPTPLAHRIISERIFLEMKKKGLVAAGGSFSSGAVQ